MTQLLSLVLLFLAATAFNINEGVALTPLMVLFLLFFVTAAGVIVIIASTRATRTSCAGRRATRSVPITNRAAITSGSSTPRCCSSPRWCRWCSARTTRARRARASSMTMTFVVMGLGTVFNALTNRREPATGLAPPLLRPGRSRWCRWG